MSVGQLASAADEALALAACSGDHLAFGELYRRYRPVIAAYVKPRVGQGAEDVIQAVFLSILKGLPTYRGPRFFPWAYRVCVNVVSDELRRNRRRAGELPGDAEVEPMDVVPTPEQVVIARRVLGQLSGTLERLPAGQRAVFLLARVEGMEYGEIAELLGIPVGTVKSRMFKAVRALLPADGVTG